MWLKGSTDITNMRQDLYDLLTGAAAAGSRGGGQSGNGAQVVGADAWTGVDAGDFIIASQRTESPFSGEYTMRRGIPRFGARTASTVISDIGQPYFSGVYALGTTRVWITCFASVTNTAPGNLSGLTVAYDVRNADTGASVASGNVTGWSGATDTRTIGSTGLSLTLTLGGSDQFVAGTNAILWMRGYTTTLTDGIDFFPEAMKVTGALTVSNSPGGSNNYTGSGTDYTLAQQLWDHPVAGDATSIAFFSAQVDWGGNGCGCGIAWNAAGSPPAAGATYYIPDTYSLQSVFFQVPNLVSIGGNFSLTPAPMDAWDATLDNGRYVMQFTTSASGPKIVPNTTQAFGRLFTGAAQAGTTFINFWISVKQDKIVVVLRGDPGQSGLTVFFTLQRYTPLVAADVWPWMFFCSAADQATNGFASLYVTSKYTYEQPYHGDPAVTFVSQQLIQAFWVSTATGTASAAGVSGIGTTLPDQNPNNWDLRWWLYALYATAGRGGSNLTGTFDSSKESGLRGKIQGIYALADDNFNNLDELADSSGTYLLIVPTTPLGTGGATESYAALAILQE